jgi:hypothetical protein
MGTQHARQPALCIVPGRQAFQHVHEHSRRFLARFLAIDTTGFSEQEVLHRQFMMRDLKMDLDGVRFKPSEMPVKLKDQLGDKFDLRAFPDEVLAGGRCHSTCSRTASMSGWDNGKHQRRRRAHINGFTE